MNDRNHESLAYHMKRARECMEKDDLKNACEHLWIALYQAVLHQRKQDGCL